MKKSSLKKLQLRKNVVADLNKTAQQQIVGGNNTQTACQPHSYTCIPECFVRDSRPCIYIASDPTAGNLTCNCFQA